MAINVYIIDVKKAKKRKQKKILEKLNAKEVDGKFLVKQEDFDSNIEYLFKQQSEIKIGLADIENGRVDTRFAPSPMFSEKFDSMLRGISND